MRYAYLHGFGSGPQSTKGVALKSAFERNGHPFHCPHLSVPSFERMTLSNALGAIDTLAAGYPEERWSMVGSSLGGYLAALWAHNNPQRVHRLLLLCPAFDFYSRRIEELTTEELDTWKTEGTRSVEDALGVSRDLHFGFVEDAQRHAGRPKVPCSTRVLHGTEDATVPIESSRAYISELKSEVKIDLEEVNADHSLHGHLELIEHTALDFLVAESGRDGK